MLCWTFNLVVNIGQDDDNGIIVWGRLGSKFCVKFKEDFPRGFFNMCQWVSVVVGKVDPGNIEILNLDWRWKRSLCKLVIKELKWSSMVFIHEVEVLIYCKWKENTCMILM